MNNILHHNWSAMTGTDWAGLMILLVISVLMAAAYFITMKPGNRDKFEQHRNFVNDDDNIKYNGEVKHVHTK